MTASPACLSRQVGDFLPPAGGVPGWSPARPAAVVPGGGDEPQRHLLSLPRGRGPSQTPPSLATDSSISPGPPSPWLPALLKGKRFLPFLRRTIGSAPGMQGAEAPCIRKLKISPFPAGEGGWGDRGKKKGKAGETSGKQSKPPPGGANAGRASAAPHPAPGMQGAKPLA